MTTLQKQQTLGSYDKNIYCVYQFAFFWYIFHDCSVYSFATIILQNISEYIDLNDDVRKWRVIMYYILCNSISLFFISVFYEFITGINKKT